MNNSITLRELTERWLQESLGVFSQSSLDHYRYMLESHVIAWFGDRVEITREELREFEAAKLAAGLSESVVFMEERLLERVLDYGSGLGLCPAPGWNLAFRTPQKKRGTVILSPEEEQRLSSFLISEPTPMHLCIFLILTTGMSVGEVLGVQWKDVSIKSNSIRVYVSRGSVISRVNKTRKVSIGERQRIYLRKMRSEPEHYLCSGTVKSRKRFGIEQRWRKVNDYLLLPSMSLTDLRHTFAVRSIEAGMGYDELASRLGIENGKSFRSFYRNLVAPEHRERLEKERFNARKVRVAPATIAGGPHDPEATPYRLKLEKRRQELKDELEALEGDLAIIRSLRNSDCVQGANRQGLYSFIEKVLGDDKDGQYLIEYLRCNMRVADMPLLKVTTVQAIRRRVTHGFEKLNKRLDEIYAVEGWDILALFQSLCARIQCAAPPAPRKTGPKPKPTPQSDFKKAIEALDRIEAALAHSTPEQ